MTPRILAALAVLTPALAVALDPPHSSTAAITCASCHVVHSAAGGAITAAAGNDNLCQSCHVTSGTATDVAMAEADQALPWPGLPTGWVGGGTSHRWDSGPAGHVEAAATNASPGSVGSAGVFVGRRAKTVTLTLTASGDAGSARFSWIDTLGASGSNLVAGAGVALGEGITVTFANATVSPSFVAGDTFLLHLRPELALPATAALALRTEGGRLMCSTCHDEHSQANEPFDPAAPPWLGAGTGEGRHFQRIASSADEACKDCHRARSVNTSASGSHPVGVTIPAGAFKTPSVLPLGKDASDARVLVQCSTCHDVHRAPAVDGTLSRVAEPRALCVECHTLADTFTPAAHLDVATGVLWPGGQYGSTFPAAVDPARRGACVNCHQPHGWPDLAADTDYPTLLVDREEPLCFTCHDGSPVADQRADFSPTVWVNLGIGASGNLRLNNHHDVLAADQATSGTRIECVACHDPHRATRAVPVVADPDPSDGRVPRPGLSWSGSDLRSELCLDCHDGSLPATVTPPTTALVNVRTTFLGTDKHGAPSTTTAVLKAGYGWAMGDVVPCGACHDAHGSSNLFHLRTVVYSKDGATPIPADTGCTTWSVTNVNSLDKTANGWCFCNTCHTGSMSGKTVNCFGCHYHGKGF
jgi:predicted CXXCH cytochrome family protein